MSLRPDHAGSDRTLAPPDPVPAVPAVPQPGQPGADEPGPAAAHLTNGRPPRRRFLVAGGVAVVLLVGGGVAVIGRVDDDDSANDDNETAATAGLGTANVERRTLEERVDLDGTLGYGDVTDVTLSSQGTVTWLPAIGSIVDRGQTLVEIDGHPVPLLFGDRPLWRELGPSAENGPDIEQLEANLVALGIVSADDLTVDQDWTSATTEAVEDWQDSLGLDDTGVITPGSVVFLPGAVRVAEHPTPVGSPVSAAVLGVTGSTHLVTVDLEATRQGLVQPGQAVGIELPDGTQTTGTVSSVGNVATASDDDDEGGGGGGDAEATVEVVVALDDPASSGTLDQAPVSVSVVSSAATDVLAVPVEALLVLAEGGYAVERQNDDGTTTLVPVELGAFADGWVEITGEVAEGDQVVIPGD